MNNCTNHYIEETATFTSSLKLGNITPVFKKDDSLDEQFLNSILYGFHKAHNTQHPLFKLLHSWQRELDSGGFVGTILMDLSKVSLKIIQHF